MTIFAHSLKDKPEGEWELLGAHLAATGDCAADLADRFGWAEVARVAGRLHDIGKCSAEFQAYIRGKRTTGGNHSTAGAREASRAYPGRLGKILSFLIAGHHAGLADAADLAHRLRTDVPDYTGWQAHAGALPPASALRSTEGGRANSWKGFEQAFLIRMLFSSLVDADSLATREFYSRFEPGTEQPPYLDLTTLRNRLRDHMAALRAKAEHDAPSALNTLRADVLDHVVARAELKPGLFTLTVPTGGGKTLASLSFALEHAVIHGLRRVVCVIPFTSIIEQAAHVFRQALKTDADILEHHASFDWEREDFRNSEDDGADALRKLQRSAENWDAPIVVTTAVQFFESLFSNQRSRCRKLHNLAKSVIVLDEAQTLPVPLLLPCLAAIEELANNYGASVVLCTATQPALRKQDAALIDARDQVLGLDIPDDRELAPNPPHLYTALKRFTIERLPGLVTDEVVASRFGEQPQMLCIVNSRKHAGALFDTIRHLPGAVHLSTLMCPRHRRMVLEELRGSLERREPVRLVATSLIEAGVDIDFPEVWRAVTGLSSILQAGGRANREGRLASGRLVVFEPAEHKPPNELAAFRQAAEKVMRKHQADAQSLDAIKDYFAELYWTQKVESLDTAKVGGYPGILKEIAVRAGSLDFPFASIAQAFRMIEDVMEPIVVPWRAGETDTDAKSLLQRIAASERPRRGDLRRMQQYVVGIPRRARRQWLASGILKPVHPGLGDSVLELVSLRPLYDEQTGVRLDGDLSADDFMI